MVRASIARHRGTSYDAASAPDAVYLEVGTRAARECAEYPDIDLRAERDEKGMRYLNKSGEPYPKNPNE